LPVEIWQKNTEWSFKHDSTEEIESITLDPDHVFRIVMKLIMYGLLPKELLKRIYFRWVFRDFSNANSFENHFFEENTLMTQDCNRLFRNCWN
jgi:hypothetical protein